MINIEQKQQINFKKGEKDIIRSPVDRQGESLNAFFNRAEEILERDKNGDNAK